MTSFIPLGSLHDRTSHWFDRAHAALLGALPCRQGCSRCCIGPFAITMVDVEVLQQGMASLPPEMYSAIEARAKNQVTLMEETFPQLASSPFLDDWADSGIDALVTTFADLPCPALATDGRCLVYPFRPMTCRMMGIPTEHGGIVEGACSVQTAVPIVKVPRALRDEEDRLVEQEALALDQLRAQKSLAGEEILLPYGFLLKAIPSPL